MKNGKFEDQYSSFKNQKNSKMRNINRKKNIIKFRKVGEVKG
jgi:hypothetical protein